MVRNTLFWVAAALTALGLLAPHGYAQVGPAYTSGQTLPSYSIRLGPLDVAPMGLTCITGATVAPCGIQGSPLVVTGGTGGSGGSAPSGTAGTAATGTGAASPVYDALTGKGLLTAGTALPAGANALGTVGVTALPALPAGTNALGTVGVTAFPSLPTGSNTIGTVNIGTQPVPSGASTATNQATQITAEQTTANAQGAPGPGSNPGSGMMGWLSGVYARLGGTLTTVQQDAAATPLSVASGAAAGSVVVDTIGYQSVGIQVSSAGGATLSYSFGPSATGPWTAAPGLSITGSAYSSTTFATMLTFDPVARFFQVSYTSPTSALVGQVTTRSTPAPSPYVNVAGTPVLGAGTNVIGSVTLAGNTGAMTVIAATTAAASGTSTSLVPASTGRGFYLHNTGTVACFWSNSVALGTALSAANADTLAAGAGFTSPDWWAPGGFPVTGASTTTTACTFSGFYR